MKIIACIFSIYILALTATPCVDAPADNCVTKIYQSQNTPGSHQNETDHCSPFCSCCCCVTPVITHVFAVDFKVYSIVQPYHPEQKPNLITTPSCTIWQPPKLS